MGAIKNVPQLKTSSHTPFDALTDFSHGGIIGSTSAIRRVVADSARAERIAIETLKGEERYQQLVEITAQELGFRDSCVRVENTGYLSWFRWQFARHSPSLLVPFL